MDKSQALSIMALVKNNSPEVNTSDIFANVKGMSIVSVEYVTQVETAAKSPLRYKIAKITRASVMMANNLLEYTNVYINKVKRTATETVSTWEPSPTYFQHTDTFCITQHKRYLDRFYLYSFYNSAKSVYVNLVTGDLMTKEEVAAELTPSSRKDLLSDNSEVYNKKNDVTHHAIVRTISLDNLASITVQGTKYTGNFVYKP